MTVRLSAAIQAHPRRAAMAQALALEIEAEVVLDPDPDGYPSPWRTYRACLESTPAWATHRLVVQDDAQACPGFREAATRALEARPDRLVSFFVAGSPWDHRDAVYESCARGWSWAELANDRWCPAIALAWPARMIPAVLAYADRKRFPERFRADDAIIGLYLREEALERALATVPSLIEHPDMVKSLVGKRDRQGLAPERVAALYIERHCDHDARDISW